MRITQLFSQKTSLKFSWFLAIFGFYYVKKKTILSLLFKLSDENTLNSQEYFMMPLSTTRITTTVISNVKYKQNSKCNKLTKKIIRKPIYCVLDTNKLFRFSVCLLSLVGICLLSLFRSIEKWIFWNIQDILVWFFDCSALHVDIVSFSWSATSFDNSLAEILLGISAIIPHVVQFLS